MFLQLFADTESGSDAIMTMASTNQSLYENMAQDVDPTYMTAASLLTDTTATYNTASATDMTTTTDTDTRQALYLGKLIQQLLAHIQQTPILV